MDENIEKGSENIDTSEKIVSSNIHKIVDTISCSLQVAQLFCGNERIAESLSIFATNMSEIIESTRNLYHEYLLRVIDHLRKIIFGIQHKKKGRTLPHSLHTLLLVRILTIYVKHLSVHFMECFVVIRKTYLLRSQDRSSSEKLNYMETMLATC